VVIGECLEWVSVMWVNSGWFFSVLIIVVMLLWWLMCRLLCCVMLWVSMILEFCLIFDSMVSSMLCLSDCVLLMMMNVSCREWFWMWVSGRILSMLWFMIFLIILFDIRVLSVLKIVCV